MEGDRIEVLAEEARGIAARSGDLRSLALLKQLESARPGLDVTTAEWTAAAEEAISLADESGDDALRMALRTVGSYSYMCAADFDNVERLVDEALELAGDDQGAGAGIVVGCPYAWCLMAKGMVRLERGEFDAADEFFGLALKIANDHGDPETEGWTRGSQAMLLVMRGELDAALRLAVRNYEITEQLGDVFSRHWALFYLGYVYGARAEFGHALDYLERAERLYREAMGRGGEAEPWRDAALADALRGVDRVPEALERADRGVAAGRERGLNWSLPRALRIAAVVRAAAGRPGGPELLDEAEVIASATRQTVELEAIREARDAMAASPG